MSVKNHDFEKLFTVNHKRVCGGLTNKSTSFGRCFSCRERKQIWLRPYAYRTTCS